MASENGLHSPSASALCGRTRVLRCPHILRPSPDYLYVRPAVSSDVRLVRASLWHDAGESLLWVGSGRLRTYQSPHCKRHVYRIGAKNVVISPFIGPLLVVAFGAARGIYRLNATI